MLILCAACFVATFFVAAEERIHPGSGYFGFAMGCMGTAVVVSAELLAPKPPGICPLPSRRWSDPRGADRNTIATLMTSFGRGRALVLSNRHWRKRRLSLTLEWAALHVTNRASSLKRAAVFPDRISIIFVTCFVNKSSYTYLRLSRFRYKPRSKPLSSV
eukprot:6028416-Pyramimonas_sp.AAC.1